MKALVQIKWLQDIFVTRKEEQNFEIDNNIKNAFSEAIVELEALSCDNCKYNIDVSDLSDEESLNIKENCLNCCNFYTNKKEI